MKKTGAPLVPFQKATFNVFNVLLLVQWLHLGFMGVKVQKIAHNSHIYPKKFGSLEKCAYFCSCKHTILIFYTLI